MQEPNYSAPIPPPTGGPGYTGGGGGGGGQTNGTMILVMGILGIVCCGILAPISWVMGNSALAEIDAGRGDASQRQTVNIGRILGMVGTGLMVLGLLWALLFGGLAAITGARNTVNNPAVPTYQPPR